MMASEARQVIGLMLPPGYEMDPDDADNYMVHTPGVALRHLIGRVL